MKQIDFYEFTGIIIPGVVMLYSLSFVSEEVRFVMKETSLSLGDFGLFLIFAYIAGHLTQAAGNIFENIFWRLFGGMPSDWIRTGKGNLLSKEQLAQLPSKIDKAIAPLETPLNRVNSRNWIPIIRGIYSTVQKAGRCNRIDIFNGNYGMFRGLSTAFFCGSAIVLFGTLFENCRVSIILAGLGILSAYRMYKFAIYYSRELFVEFLQVTGESK